MKTYLLCLLALAIVSVRSPAFATDDPPSKPPAGTTPPAAANEGKPAEGSKANVLANRIQSVTASQSPIVTAIVKMVESGVEPSVIEAYAQTATLAPLRPDEILYLHNHGVSSQAITALIKRGGELKAQQMQAGQQAQLQMAQLAQQQPAQPSIVAMPPSQPAPTYNYYVDYPPSYSYAYPSYSYPYFSYPLFSYGFYSPFSFGYYSPTHRHFSSYGHAGFGHYPNFHSGGGAGFNSGHGNPTFHSGGGAGFNSGHGTSFFSSTWMANGNSGRPVSHR